jgi:hypothetical protein
MHPATSFQTKREVLRLAKRCARGREGWPNGEIDNDRAMDIGELHIFSNKTGTRR